MLADLQNSVITGVLLVAIIILFALGFRASLFIGIAIPASFLAGVLGLQLAGLTVNIVVLFSLDPGRRHAGRRRDHRVGVRRAPHGRRHAAARGLLDGREAHGRSGDRCDRDARRGVLAAAVLARHRRRVHEVHADHADRDAVGLARGRAVLHADARRAARARRAGAARRARQGPRALHAHGAPRAAPSGHDAHARRRAAGRRADGLRQVRTRRRVLPQGRARLRPGRDPCARQPLARREGPAGAPGRGPRAEVLRPQDGLYPRRRAAAPVERDRRGHDRRDPVRVRQLAAPRAGGTRSWTRSATRPRTSPASWSR